MFEVSLADLQQDEDQAFRKIKLRAEDVQGKNVLTNFWVCGTMGGVDVLQWDFIRPFATMLHPLML